MFTWEAAGRVVPPGRVTTPTATVLDASVSLGTHTASFGVLAVTATLLDASATLGTHAAIASRDGIFVNATNIPSSASNASYIPSSAAPATVLPVTGNASFIPTTSEGATYGD